MELEFLLHTCNLAQIIDFATRIGPTSASLMDNFFLDRNVYNKFQAYCIINGLFWPRQANFDNWKFAGDEAKW
jgi:hypothetical protein